MKRILFVVFMCYVAFLLEVSLFNHFGSWAKPELLILVVIFFTLFLGIRYGIIAALVAGLFRDGISISPYGTYIFIYICVAYAITYLRQFLYQPGSKFARVVMAFFGYCVAFMIHTLIKFMSNEYPGDEILSDVFVPQLMTTVIAATFVFSYLKKLSEIVRLK